MNAYKLAMEQCAVPDGLPERLRDAVLAQRPETTKPFRPKGFVRKARLVLLAAVLLLLLGAAAVWDSALVKRFGPMAALSYMGGATFQEVNVTSVCDDVSLTVTQALCSEKSIFYILVYTLPEELRGQGCDIEISGEWQYYGTGDITWEILKEQEGEAWQQADWNDYMSYMDIILNQDGLFAPYDMVRTRFQNGGGMSGYGVCQGVDTQAGTMTWMMHIALGTGNDWDFTSQPLTILVPPPRVTKDDGTSFPAANHPAIITFQPVYEGPQSLAGCYQDDAVELRATLTPFSLSLFADECGYEDEWALYWDTWLITETGREIPASLVGWINGGAMSSFVSTTVHTYRIIDTSEYTAVRIGKYVLPLTVPEA